LTEKKIEIAPVPAVIMDRARLEEFALTRPMHAWMDLRVMALSDADVELSIPWRREFVSNPDLMSTHGGILATLIDVAGCYACTARIGRSAPTLELTVSFVKMARPGLLRVRGSIEHWSAKTAIAGASVHDEAGDVVASGRGTYYVGQPKS
jgi:uncharacterized protein (TIGR00369 family)